MDWANGLRNKILLLEYTWESDQLGDEFRDMNPWKIDKVLSLMLKTN